MVDLQGEHIRRRDPGGMWVEVTGVQHHFAGRSILDWHRSSLDSLAAEQCMEVRVVDSCYYSKVVRSRHFQVARPSLCRSMAGDQLYVDDVQSSIWELCKYWRGRASLVASTYEHTTKRPKKKRTMTTSTTHRTQSFHADRLQ